MSKHSKNCKDTNDKKIKNSKKKGVLVKGENNTVTIATNENDGKGNGTFCGNSFNLPNDSVLLPNMIDSKIDPLTSPEEKIAGAGYYYNYIRNKWVRGARVDD